MIKHILILIGFSISIYSCSSSSTVKQKKVAQVNEPYFPVTYQDSVEAKSLFLKGVTAFELGDVDESLDYLTNAMIKLPTSPGILHALADAYLATNDPTNAVYYATQAVKQEPDNIWFKLKVVEIHERTGNIESAIDVMKELIQSQPQKVEYYYKLADLYTKNSDLQSANNVYAEMIKKYGGDEVLHYRRYTNFNSIGKKDSALVELKKLAKIKQGDVSILYSIAELQISLNQDKEAKKTLNSILERNPQDQQALGLLLRMLIQQKDWLSLERRIDKTIDDNTVELGTKEQIIRTLIAVLQQSSEEEKGEVQRILFKNVERVVAQYPEESEAHLIKATVYLTLQNDELALPSLKKAIQLNEKDQSAWAELIQLWLRQSNFYEIIENSAKAELAFPENAFIQYAVGISHFSLKEYKEAIEWLNKASFSPARREFKSIIFTILGDAYNEIDNWPKSSVSYESAIKMDPNNATALNNYAYYLSVRSEKLNEAKMMSKKSLDIEPENPSFLDTYGWILYQIKEYDEAKIYIQKAVDVGGASPEVYEHLGDVYQKLGNLVQAKKWWKLAFEMDPKRTYLQVRFNDEL